MDNPMPEMYRYKVITKDAISDPFRLTGSWFVAQSPSEALDRLAIFGGWGPSHSAKLVIANRYNFVRGERVFADFDGDGNDWIQAVRYGVIAEDELYWFVPDANTEVKRRKARPVTPVRKPKLAERLEASLRRIGDFKYIIIWTSILLAAVAAVVALVYFPREVQDFLSPLSGFAFLVLLVWLVLRRLSR